VHMSAKQSHLGGLISMRTLEEVGDDVPVGSLEN
jgi:hypothetical protein